MASSNVQYPWPSTTNVANFVSTKLRFDRTSTNYLVWKEQMLCLIEGQDLLGFIDGSIFPPPPPPPPPPRTAKTATAWKNDYLVWRRSDRLLKGWMLGSLSENMVTEVAVFGNSRYVWVYLENKFSNLLNQFQPQNVAAAPSATDMIEYMPLYKAALAGDWETAKRIFDQDPGAKSAALNDLGSTPLEVAVGTGKRAIHFVQKMVEMIPPGLPADEELMITAQNNTGRTALHIAAAVGNIEAATILATRAPRLLYIPNFHYNNFPVQIAALHAHKRMLEYLISVTKEQAPYAGMAGLRLLMYAIDAEFFDVALYLVDKYPYLAKLRLPNDESALSTVAANESAFTNGSRRGWRFSFWEHFVPYVRGVTINRTIEKEKMKEQARSLVKCLCDKMGSMSYSEATDITDGSVMTATRLGIHEVVEMIVEAFPDAIYTLISDSNQSIFHVAVLNRSEQVFNLIYQMSDHRYMYPDATDKQGNSLLHAAGQLAPSHRLNQISGAAIQMQREIQWYKEVEKIVNPDSRKRLNKQGKSPKMVFTEEHKNLKEEGEKWMKDTSESCTIVAALIVTIMFAAAITVPGGNESGSGFPIFSKENMFLVFAISDVLSLFASTTSLLMFLSILTSRYAEEDFLHVLPTRLILGLGSLFVSITFMMVAFSATVYLLFGHKKAWVLIPVAVLGCLPITSFGLLQFPLLIDLVSSTFGSGIFGGERSCCLLTPSVCRALLSLADARESLYGPKSMEEDLRSFNECCNATDPKLYHSLMLRIVRGGLLIN